MIRIVDYGMGNLRSVQKAFERLGVAAEIATRPADLASTTHLVLPGVGAFRDAIAELKRQDFVNAVRDHIAADRPFLGICLGLQLLFDVSYEDGQWEGLGIVPGEVIRFQPRPGLKIPHMGWNTIRKQQDCPVLDGIPDGTHFYFVHSYYVTPRDEEIVAAHSEHGTPFVAAIARNRMFATQFHPEKSQRWGLQLLKNFAALPATTE